MKKKLRRKLPPARAAMTGAPGKYVIDYFFCIGWSISWPNSLRGGFFGNVSVHSSITAKRRLIHLDKYQGQSCNRRLCSKSCCNGRGGKKNKKNRVYSHPLAQIRYLLLPPSLTVESVIKMESEGYHLYGTLQFLLDPSSGCQWRGRAPMCISLLHPHRDTQNRASKRLPLH